MSEAILKFKIRLLYPLVNPVSKSKGQKQYANRSAHGSHLPLKTAIHASGKREWQSSKEVAMAQILQDLLVGFAASVLAAMFMRFFNK